MAETLALKGGRPVISPGAHVRWPVIDAADKVAVLEALDRGVLSGPFAPEVRRLEKEFAAYLGAKHCLATNSGTAALHIAVAAAGIGPGDEVITPAFSFVASALSILHQGAVPVFADIEPLTFGLDPAKVEAAITPRTKAIMPVHIHGTACRIDELKAIAKKHNLVVIEDACQAHGAESRGRKLGTIGEMGAFSIQSSKNLAAGEGGLFVTNDDALMERANRTRMFGEDIRPTDAAGYRTDRALDGNRAYDSLHMGWMYRTNEMTAALARSQLGRLDKMNDNARENGRVLTERLSTLVGVRPPVEAEGGKSSIHKYRVRLEAEKLGVKVPAWRVRDAMVRALAAEGVDAVLWQTKPVPGQRLFQEKIGFGKGFPWSASAPVSYDLAQYPETTRLLEDSLVLFSHSYPIAAQPRALAEAYGEAFHKVWSRLDEVLAATA
ncbi:MAG: DegT/DnrJ/EryC1/StrS family aminotransferase [Myxococcota bacterium]